MSSPASDKVTREELFALVWEKPATEVAKDLGVSDVALQKLCRRLQVPTPPRGYWAKVKAGQAPRRPNLEAFSEQLDAFRRTPPPGLVYLTAKQDEYLKRALDELAKAGTDTGECALAYRMYLRLLWSTNPGCLVDHTQTPKLLSHGGGSDVLVCRRKHYSVTGLILAFG